ncbi:MAG: DedA family protein [Hyphomicrobium aestuarii]|nr:DedA family protein [Hyphomicrobium aestuarii]
MDFKAYVDVIVEFVKTHDHWAVPIVFLLSFAESLAFLSILVPSTAIMIALGALFGASGIAVVPVWLAAVIGSTLGYAVSYWIGLYFKNDMATMWPFTAYPEMLPRGRQFFDQYGTYGVFIGHLIGPLRAVVPVVAGMCAMPQIPFQIANIAASIVWASLVLLPAYFGLEYLKGWIG